MRFRERLHLLLALALLGGVLRPSWAQAKGGSEVTDPRASARVFVQLLAQERYEEAVKNFGSPLNLPATDLRNVWAAIVAKRGAFKKVRSVRLEKTEEYGGRKYEVVLVNCKFSQSDYALRLSYSSGGKITSLWFVPAAK